MPTVVNVAIHSSQFPENVRRDLLDSLRARQVNHKFHYDNIKQTQKWLLLHATLSPSRTDPDCAAAYERVLWPQRAGSKRCGFIWQGLVAAGDRKTRVC